MAMTMDEETRVRDLFAAVEVQVPVDAERAMKTGKRQRVASRVGAVGVAAIAVALVAVAWSVVTATPDAPKPVAALPAANPATAPVVPISSEFTLGSWTLDSVTTTVDESGGNILVNMSLPAFGSHDATVVHLTQPADKPAVAHVVYGDLLVVVHSSDVTVLTVAMKNGINVDSSATIGLGNGDEADFFSFRQANATKNFQGILWKNADGSVADSVGGDLCQGTGTLGGKEVTAYADPEWDLFVVDSGDGSTTGSPFPTNSLKSTLSDGIQFVSSVTVADDAKSYAIDTTSMALLPGDATRVKPVFSGPGGSWTTVAVRGTHHSYQLVVGSLTTTETFTASAGSAGASKATTQRVDINKGMKSLTYTNSRGTYYVAIANPAPLFVTVDPADTGGAVVVTHG